MQQQQFYQPHFPPAQPYRYPPMYAQQLYQGQKGPAWVNPDPQRIVPGQVGFPHVADTNEPTAQHLAPKANDAVYENL